jgi:anti-anti-sigma factor
MEVEVRNLDEVILIDLDGRLVAGTGAEQLQAVMNELLAADWKRIVINLSKVTKIDSAGIGELVASSRLAQRFGSQVKLINLEGQVRRIFELSQLLPLMAIYDSEEAALAAFDGAAAS